MPEWKWFVLGLLVGWMIEWIIDWVWWRRRRTQAAPADSAEPEVRVVRQAGALIAPVAVAAQEPSSPEPAVGLFNHDHLELIEGIGPKVAALLRARGILSFGQLAAASPGHLARLIDEAGPKFKAAFVASWPEQASLAASGDWDALERLQKALVASQKAGQDHAVR